MSFDYSNNFKMDEEDYYVRIDQSQNDLTERIKSQQRSQDYCSIYIQMLAKVYSCVCCDPRPTFPEPYSFHFSASDSQQGNHTSKGLFQSNEIRTTKYNVLNFLPKSIISQYQRLANVYFLMVAIISTIPDVTPLNPALIWIPLLLVLIISIIKELYEDYSRYKTDKEVNESKEVAVLRNGKLQQIKWKEVLVGDMCRIQEQEMFPADVLLISSSDRDGLAYIETSSLDGEQTSKVRYAFHQLNNRYREETMVELRGKFQGEVPNPSLTQFRGTLEVEGNKLAITDNSQLFFRGSKLKNTKWIWGIVVYTGQCTKIMMNGQSFVTKLSAVERKLNYLLIILLICQVTACVVVSALSTSKQMSMRESQHYPLWRTYGQSKLFVMNFLLFFIEYSSCIPISLIISIEIVKTTQSYFIDFDQLMFSSWRNRKAFARTAALNEELGQVEYLFCDKTGTLTKNELKFHTAVIGDEAFEFQYNNEDRTYRSDRLSETMLRQNKTRLELVLAGANDYRQIKKFSQLIEEYLLCLLLCNNVNTIDDEKGGSRFQSESPDQLALIEMAKNIGYVFLRRDKDSVTVEIMKEVHKIEVVARFPFSSDRKRMSILVRWRGSFILYVKGADNVILQRALPSPFCVTSSVDRLSRSGLRSLLIAARLISDKDVGEFAKDLALASVSERQLVMEQYAAIFEKNLTILGATGLLDQLQTDVPQTLRDFQRANIKVWMLTGDKLQTALEIGKSCGLIQPDYQLVIMRPNSVPIIEYLTECEGKVTNTLKKYSLVVQGSVLSQVFGNQLAENLFAQLSLHFASVICCRMLPSQKSLAVRMVKTRLDKICLAVGDGGNDVSMIKQANIGVGIYGEEGMNAVQASDYALPQFKMLWRLLFVHGRWNYMRISDMILYFTYKSLLFTVPRFLFSFTNAFSGQPVYDDYYIALYNVVFTALPLIIRALFEQDVNYVTKVTTSEIQANNEQSTETGRLPQGYRINLGLKKLFPKLYFIGQNNQIFNVRQILLWLLQAVLLGICLFFIAERVLGSLSINIDGHGSSLQIVSITIYTAVIMLVTIKLGIQVRHWTKLLFISILFLSVGPYIAFMWVLNYRFKRPVQGTLYIYFSSVKTYMVILLIVMVLLAINGIMIYIRFHSHRILKQITIALQQDGDMVSYISENQEKKRIESQGLIRPKSNQTAMIKEAQQ